MLSNITQFPRETSHSYVTLFGKFQTKTESALNRREPRTADSPFCARQAVRQLGQVVCCLPSSRSSLIHTERRPVRESRVKRTIPRPQASNHRVNQANTRDVLDHVTRALRIGNLQLVADTRDSACGARCVLRVACDVCPAAPLRVVRAAEC